MSSYERVWTVVAGSLLALGMLAALLVPGPLQAMALFLSAGMMGAVSALGFLCLKETVPTGRLARYPVIGGAVSGLLAVALAGWGYVFGAPTLLILVALALTSPWVGTAVRRWRRGSSSEQVPEIPEDDAQVAEPTPVAVIDQHFEFVVPDAMDDADICQAWCSSFVALQRAGTAESLLRVVQVRALYLDAFERRDREAFVTWMASGVRAAADPAQFLTD